MVLYHKVQKKHAKILPPVDSLPLSKTTRLATSLYIQYVSFLMFFLQGKYDRSLESENRT